MSEDKELTKKETLERFEEICGKFETWSCLYESDVDFEINPDAKEDLEEEEDLSIEKIALLEEQILFNDITDNADLLYAELLKLAKIIVTNFNRVVLLKEKFVIRTYNCGVSKMVIDSYKCLNEMTGERDDCLEMEKIDPVIDKKELTRYLFG